MSGSGEPDSPEDSAGSSRRTALRSKPVARNLVAIDCSRCITELRLGNLKVSAGSGAHIHRINKRPYPARVAPVSDAWPLTSHVSSVTHSRSVLRRRLQASSAPALTTSTSAVFSLRQCRRPFWHKAKSHQVRVAHLHRTTTASSPPRLGHKSLVVSGPLALPGSAFYAALVHRLAIYAPRFLPTVGRPYAVALRFAHCDQLAAGLAPASMRPCWAHQ